MKRENRIKNYFKKIKYIVFIYRKYKEKIVIIIK